MTWRRGPASRLGARSRIEIAAIAAFVGFGALYGGVMLLADPDGLGVRRTWLNGTPFSGYTIPGLVLLLIGGGMLTTALLAVLRHRLAATAAVLTAVALLGWGAVETAVIGFRGWPQVILLAIWVIGPVVALLAVGGPPTFHSARTGK